MSNTSDMQDKDSNMFNGAVVRQRYYRGPDKTLLSKGEITQVKPADHGAKPLLGKFSPINLSQLLPEQRKIFLEQMKFELSLKGEALNQYLTARYTEEDMYKIWEMQQKASKRRKNKIGTPIKNKGKKRKTTLAAKRRVLTPEQKAEKLRKFRETLARNKADPDYVSFNQLKKEFRLRQKLLVQRSEKRTKQAIAIFASDTINRKVYHKTRKLQIENAQLKEFIKQNGMHLPGSSKEKIRRQEQRT